MLVDASATGVVAEVVDDQVEWCVGPVGLGAGDVDAGVAEAHDVGAFVAGGAGQESGVLVDAPAARVVRGADAAARVSERFNAISQRFEALNVGFWV